MVFLLRYQMRLEKMKRELDKRTITFGQVDNLLVALSKKYSLESDSINDSSSTEIDFNVSPDSVITETFVQ